MAVADTCSTKVTAVLTPAIGSPMTYIRLFTRLVRSFLTNFCSMCVDFYIPLLDK